MKFHLSAAHPRILDIVSPDCLTYTCAPLLDTLATAHFHFSDGDNWSDSDNKISLDIVKELLGFVNLFGYGEIRDGGYTSSLMSAFTGMADPRFVIVSITEKKDVYPALQKWFTRGDISPV